MIEFFKVAKITILSSQIFFLPFYLKNPFHFWYFNIVVTPFNMQLFIYLILFLSIVLQMSQYFEVIPILWEKDNFFITF